MTHNAARAARICPACDGFPVVAISTGTRNPDGTRTTLTVSCPACHGTGTAPTWLVTRRSTVASSVQGAGR